MFETAAKTWPDDREAGLQRAEHLIFRGKEAEAVEWLDKRLQAEPKDLRSPRGVIPKPTARASRVRNPVRRAGIEQPTTFVTIAIATRIREKR